MKKSLSTASLLLKAEASGHEDKQGLDINRKTYNVFGLNVKNVEKKMQIALWQ